MINRFRKSVMIVLAFGLIWSVAAETIGLQVAQAAIQAQLYVDPGSGSDANSGTSPGSAFQTLVKARDTVRAMNGSMTGDIVVNLMPGNYYVTDTIDFTASDSATNGHTIVWRNYGAKGSARLIGGVAASGWTLDTGNIYKTSVGTGLKLKYIYENGTRAILARHPNTGYFRIDSNVSPYSQFRWKSANSIPSIPNKTELEVEVWPGNHDWSNFYRGVASINYSNRQINLSSPIPNGYLDTLSANSRFSLQGAYELLNAEGEFYYDSATGDLYYYPHQTPIADQEIIIPHVICLFNFTGDIENVVIEGLKFEATNLDTADEIGIGQGMISMDGVRHMTVRNNEFVRAGGSAVFVQASENILVEGNYIDDMGMAGVYLYANPNIDASTASKVTNNRINNTAQAFADWGGGIALKQSHYNEVSYNHISKSERHGITMRASNYNTVKFNEVLNTNLNSQDTGGIYFGNSDHNTIDNNRVHHSGYFGRGQTGIYVEGGSDDSLVQNNIVYNIGNDPSNELITPIRVNGGVRTLTANNIFDFSTSYAGVRFFNSNNTQLQFEHNIYASFGPSRRYYQFIDYQNNTVASSENNLFWKTASGANVMLGIPNDDTLSNWKTLQSGKYDQNSFVSDPLFVDRANFDYTLQSNSPAFTLGFTQIDQDSIGLKPEFALPGTKGQWVFHQDADDVSLSGNNGTANGGAAYGTDRFGEASSALSVNGTNAYVSIAHNGSLSFGAPSNPFTVAAWIKTSASGVQIAVSKARPNSGSANIDYNFGLNSSGNLQFWRWNSSTGQDSVNYAGTALNDGEWHHIAFVNENSSSHKLYLDGQLVESSTDTWTSNNQSNQPLEIGRFKNYTSATHYFNGQIDDVILLDRALTANEIKEINHIPLVP